MDHTATTISHRTSAAHILKFIVATISIKQCITSSCLAAGYDQYGVYPVYSCGLDVKLSGLQYALFISSSLTLKSSSELKASHPQALQSLPNLRPYLLHLQTNISQPIQSNTLSSLFLPRTRNENMQFFTTIFTAAALACFIEPLLASPFPGILLGGRQICCCGTCGEDGCCAWDSICCWILTGGNRVRRTREWCWGCWATRIDGWISVLGGDSWVMDILKNITARRAGTTCHIAILNTIPIRQTIYAGEKIQMNVPPQINVPDQEYLSA